VVLKKYGKCCFENVWEPWFKQKILRNFRSHRTGLPRESGRLRPLGGAERGPSPTRPDRGRRGQLLGFLDPVVAHVAGRASAVPFGAGSGHSASVRGPGLQHRRRTPERPIGEISCFCEVSCDSCQRDQCSSDLRLLFWFCYWNFCSQ